MPGSQTYTRGISVEEWWRFGAPPGLVTEDQFCVEGDGAIDPVALAEAVAAASLACPGARLVRRGFTWADSGRAPAVKVVQAGDFDRARLDSALLRTPLTCASTSGSTEVVLVQGAPSTVIFRAHPGVMDGRGVMLWQQQVFRALRGDAVEGATSRLNVDEVKAEVVASLGIDQPSPSAPSKTEWRSVLGELPSGPRRSMWRRRTIDGIHLGVAAKIARLVTAYGDGESDGSVGFPVDLRPYLPGLRTTAGVTGHVTVHVADGDDWNDVTIGLLKALSEHEFLASLGDPTVLAMPLPFMRELSRWMDNLARKTPDVIRERKLADHIATVSYLGAVDLADFCADGFEATSSYCLGAVTYSPELDIVESGGRTEVTVAWRDGPGAAGRAEALLDWIEEGLSPRAARCWDGNLTDQPVPDGAAGTLTGLFAAQAARTPAAVAISSPDGDMTYAELAGRSAAVAAALRARGIGRDDRVGLVAGRSADSIVAVWGILRAGAAYLAIDDSNPDARIAQLLTDAHSTVCLLEPLSAGRDFVPPGCQGISLSSLPHTEPADWRDADCRPDDLASIIYTSGSTGAPKGVEIEHRGLVNFARWATREAGIDSSTRIPLVGSMSFDIIGFSIFLPLLAGGTVLPVREVNAATLREVIEDGGINLLAVTPSHLDLISHAGVRRSTVRVVIAGGELLRRSTALRALATFGPDCRILNHWGPSEASIANAAHEFDPERDTDAGVPFGRPMDNNTIYLLDPQGRFVRPGEPGEAYVGGIQVARGYLGRPDLTRQRFTRLADGTRVYRTGDIVRLLPAGDLTFISRADDQVKIAGHRIEPAEIAQALEEHPHVTQAAVIPRTRPGRHEKELCAYITTDTGSTPDDLKTHLAQRLPGYMIPAVILTVPGIPQTLNGKTDPGQLPDPFAATAAAATPVPGRDEITTAIAAIWARTLQLDPAAIDEQTDFRELGGSSILMLTMIDEVSATMTGAARDRFTASLAQIIREPTLTRISILARQTQTTPSAGTRKDTEETADQQEKEMLEDRLLTR
jgi:amino acid adenylation domain-containing protein